MDSDEVSPGAIRAARLGAAIEGIARDAATIEGRRDVPDGWSTSEILAHLVEMLPYWAEQARTVAQRPHNGEPFGRTHDDPARIAAVERGAEEDARTLLPRVREALAQATAVLEAIPAADWQRSGRHANRGEMTVAMIVDQFLVDHANEHAAQFQAVLAGG